MSQFKPIQFNSVHAAEPSIGITDLMRVVASSWRQIVFMGAIATGLAAVILAFQPRTFEATTTVIYDPPAGLALTSTSRWLEPSADGGMRLDSQVEILRSPSLAKRVIRELRLVGDGSLGSPDPSSGDTASQDAKPVQITTDKPAQSAAGASMTDEMVESQVPVFLSRLSARRIGGSTAIEIGYRSRDPELAVRVANAIAEFYITTDVERKSESLKRGSIWLQNQLDNLRKDAFDALSKVEEFKRAGLGTTTNAPVRLAELQSSAQTYQSMYERVHLQLMDTLQKVSYPVADARIMSSATTFQLAVRPRIQLILAFAATLGLGLGVVYSLLKLSQDGRVRNRQDLIKIGVPLAGTIEAVEAVPLWPLAGKPQSIGAHPVEPRIEFEPHILPRRSSGSMAIGVCGLASGRDVDNTAIVLARYFAKRNQISMVVDTRIDWSPATRSFLTGNELGFFDAVTGHTTLESLQPIEIERNVSILPSGSAEIREFYSGERNRDHFRSHAFQSVVNGLKERCDFCIFELPPLSIRDDACLSGAFFDGMFIVADAGIAEGSELTNVLERLAASNSFVLGVLLDKTTAFARVRIDHRFLDTYGRNEA